MKLHRKHIIFSILLVLQPVANAREIKIDLDAGQRTMVQLEEPGRIRFCSSLPSINISETNVMDKTFFRIRTEGYIPNYHPGTPELPVRNQLIEFPLNSNPQISIISWKADTVRLSKYGINSSIYPSQLSSSKKLSPDSITSGFEEGPVQYSGTDIHGTVKFIPIGTSRGNSIGMITLSPFFYDQENMLLIIVNDLVFEISWPVTAENAYKSDKIRVQSDVFNKSLLPLTYTSMPVTITVSSGKPIKYLILSDTVFRECLQPFIRWKTRKGFQVMELYRGLPGVGESREEMKATLKSMYDSATPDDPAPLFLLIAGDVEHIPASQASGQLTDLYYAEYDGEGDYFPELFYGRFSASDTSEMRILIEKTIQHEQYLFPDPSFLNKSVLIAGVDGQYAEKWGNGQVNYMTRYYLNPEHGNTVSKFPYPGSGGMADSIKAEISRGASLVNYTGHGYPDRWDNPRFSKADIAGLQNKDKYPLMIGNGCSTATFDDPECFAEALVRAENKGALAYIGCTNDSYWDEDYFWAVGIGPVSANPSYDETTLGVFDRFFHEHDEAPNEWFPALGQMLYAGNLAVTAGNINRAKYYWEIYHVFGDPSLIPFLSEPEPMFARHSSSIHKSSSNLSLITEPWVYAAISTGDSLLEAGYTGEDGLIDFKFDGNTAGSDSIILTITGQNRQPYIAGMIILPDTVPFIDLLEVILNDSRGNMNTLADYGEALEISPLLVNRGSKTSDSLFMTLSSEYPLIEITNSTNQSGPVPQKSEFSPLLPFSIRIPDSIQNNYTIPFRLEISDKNSGTQLHYFDLLIHAPDLSLKFYEVDDRQHGNGNGILDPGEKAVIRCGIRNEGDSETGMVLAFLKDLTGNISIPDSSQSAGVILPKEMKELSFYVSVDSSVSKGTWVDFPLQIISGPYEIFDTIQLPLGLISEDFESGSFKIRPWTNIGLIPWVISLETTQEGTFSARSGDCMDFDTSALQINITSIEDDNISFWYRVSSEWEYDYFRFLMDGIEIDHWSGEFAWQKLTHPVPAGNHSFTWLYIKDKTLTKGADAAWIDFIQFPEGSFTQNNTGIISIHSPLSVLPLPIEDSLRIWIRNFGNSAIDSLPLGYTVNDTLTCSDTLFTRIQPGDSIDFTFRKALKLSKGYQYYISAYTSHPLDEFRGNDTLSIRIWDETFIDAGLGSVSSPDASDSIFTDSETVSLWLHNKGNQVISDIPLIMQIDGIYTLQESFSDSILPSDSLLYTFSARADLSGYGTHSLLLIVDYLGDNNPDNDSIWQKYEHREPALQVQEPFKSGMLTIFPNPASGIFQVGITETIPGRISLEVRNASGKQIHGRNISNAGGEFRTSVNLTGFPDGIYFLKLISNHKSYSGYLIKHSGK